MKSLVASRNKEKYVRILLLHTSFMIVCKMRTPIELLQTKTMRIQDITTMFIFSRRGKNINMCVPSTFVGFLENA